jgi:hypothetical protein
VVVACSDLKTIAPESRLCLRTVEGRIDERIRTWRERTGVADGSISACKLYKGQHWHAAMSAASRCRAMGWDVRLWIASAGYGLIEESALVSAYSATFASGHSDSVWRGPRDGVRVPTLAIWWSELASGRFVDLAVDTSGPVIVVAGADYVDALRNDLETLRTNVQASARVSVVSTSCTHALALRYTAEISGTLRCTLGALNATLFAALADTADTHNFCREKMQSWLEVNLGHSRRPRPNRRSVTDAELARQVRRMRRRDPDISRSSALRTLRTSGIACSQARFASYWAARRLGDTDEHRPDLPAGYEPRTRTQREEDAS